MLRKEIVRHHHSLRRFQYQVPSSGRPLINLLPTYLNSDHLKKLVSTPHRRDHFHSSGAPSLHYSTPLHNRSSLIPKAKDN